VQVAALTKDRRRGLLRPMKIVFLDFDGVMSHSFMPPTRATTAGKFSAGAIARLNTIVERTGARIVVSSSWRAHYALDALKALLAAEGFTGEVLDCTPVLQGSTNPVHGAAPGHTRSQEIQAWLDGFPEPPESFVILDDIELPPLADWHVKTSAETGLLDDHVETAIAILGMTKYPKGSHRS
jgi:hypothetical protein